LKYINIIILVIVLSIKAHAEPPFNVETSSFPRVWVWGDLTIAAHNNLPAWDVGGIHLGTLPKNASPYGGYGLIKIFSDDAFINGNENYLQGNIGILTSPIPEHRVFLIEVIEQNTAFRNVVINPSGGFLGLGTMEPHKKLEIMDGDLYINHAPAQIFMKSTNGACWSLSITNDGQISIATINCP